MFEKTATIIAICIIVWLAGYWLLTPDAQTNAEAVWQASQKAIGLKLD